MRTNSDEMRERNDTERVVGTCGACGGPVVDGREFIQAHCRHCGAVPKSNLPVIEMEPVKLTPTQAAGLRLTTRARIPGIGKKGGGR